MASPAKHHCNEAAADTWRAGIVQRLRGELESLAPAKRSRIDELARAFEAMDSARVLRLYNATVSAEANATSAPGFPELGQEPSNISPAEMEEHW